MSYHSFFLCTSYSLLDTHPINQLTLDNGASPYCPFILPLSVVHFTAISRSPNRYYQQTLVHLVDKNQCKSVSSVSSVGFVFVFLFHAKSAEHADFSLRRIPYTDYAVAGIYRIAPVARCLPGERKPENSTLHAHPLSASRSSASRSPFSCSHRASRRRACPSDKFCVFL